MNILLRVLQAKYLTKGFTLIELIAASIMTLFIVGAAGFGMTVMLREQTVATADSDIQYNLGRAVDFISEEVRQASSITTTAVWPTGSSTSCSSAAPAGSTRTFVLGLTIPPGTTTNVIYFTDTPPSSPWIGQSAIYRCGPSYRGNGGTIDDNGTSNPSDDVSIFSNGFTKTTSPLIDLIASPSGLTSSPCSSGFGSASPNFTNGFFVCVNSGNNKLVEIHAFASARAYIEARVGNLGADSRYLAKSTYSASTQVFARSKVPIPLTSSTSSGGTFSAPSSSANATFVTSGCPTTFFPASPVGSGIDIDGTTTNITANGTVSVIISGTSLNLTPPTVSPALTDFTFTASTNGGTFTSGSCTVVANLST